MHARTSSPTHEVTEIHDKEEKKNLEEFKENDKGKEDKGEEVPAMQDSNIDSSIDQSKSDKQGQKNLGISTLGWLDDELKGRKVVVDVSMGKFMDYFIK